MALSENSNEVLRIHMHFVTLFLISFLEFLISLTLSFFWLTINRTM